MLLLIRNAQWIIINNIKGRLINKITRVKMDENNISQIQRNTEIITDRQKNTIDYCRIMLCKRGKKYLE